MKNNIRKKNIKNGGKRPGSGRKKRETAVLKTVLIEKDTVEFYTSYGDGYLGRGMDKAADFLKRLGKVVLE